MHFFSISTYSIGIFFALSDNLFLTFSYICDNLETFVVLYANIILFLYIISRDLLGVI